MRKLKLVIVFAVAAFGGIGSAFATVATGPCVGPSDDPGGVCDITARVVQVVPPPPSEGDPSVALSNTTQTNYVKYRVTLEHYADRREGFSQVVFKADTLVAASNAGPAKFVAASAAAIANAGSAVLQNPTTACAVSTTDPKHIDCTFNFSPPFDNPADNSAQATITFDVTVQSPTADSAGTLNLKTETRYTEAGGQPEPEYYALTTTGLTQLTVPDPTVVATYLPTAGTVTTGTTQGAPTCTSSSDPNRWINTVKVPAEAQVGVNLNRIAGEPYPPATQYFSTLAIPGQVFGEGIHWYDRGAASSLLVITQIRHKCTIGSGNGTLKDALIGLKDRVYYKPDHPTPHNPNQEYKPVYFCLVSGGPKLGEPCLLYEYFDKGRNLVRVLYANENGKYAN